MTYAEAIIKAASLTAKQVERMRKLTINIKAKKAAKAAEEQKNRRKEVFINGALQGAGYTLGTVIVNTTVDVLSAVVDVIIPPKKR